MLAQAARRAVQFLRQEDGPTAVEYAVMLALIIVVCVAAVTALGSNTNATFNNAQLKTALDQAVRAGESSRGGGSGGVCPRPGRPASGRKSASSGRFPLVSVFLPGAAMQAITKSVVSFLKQEDGPTAVEYAVMLALIIVVCIAAVTAIGSNSNQTFSAVGSAIKPAAEPKAGRPARPAVVTKPGAAPHPGAAPAVSRPAANRALGLAARPTPSCVASRGPPSCPPT